MAFAEDLETLLVPSVISKLYISAKAQIPDGPGPLLSVIETGGSGPEYVQNQVAPAYRKPSAQFTARATTYVAARTLAHSAWNRLAAIHNQTVGGTLYRSIKPLQEPFGDGEDEKGRPLVKFNVIAD